MTQPAYRKAVQKDFLDLFENKPDAYQLDIEFPEQEENAERNERYFIKQMHEKAGRFISEYRSLNTVGFWSPDNPEMFELRFIRSTGKDRTNHRIGFFTRKGRKIVYRGKIVDAEMGRVLDSIDVPFYGRKNYQSKNTTNLFPRRSRYR